MPGATKFILDLFRASSQCHQSVIRVSAGSICHISCQNYKAKKKTKICTQKETMVSQAYLSHTLPGVQEMSGTSSRPAPVGLSNNPNDLIII